MNKRSAKQLVAGWVSYCLRAIEAEDRGAPTCPTCDVGALARGCPDCKRIADAWDALIKELARRGGGLTGDDR